MSGVRGISVERTIFNELYAEEIVEAYIHTILLHRTLGGLDGQVGLFLCIQTWLQGKVVHEYVCFVVFCAVPSSSPTTATTKHALTTTVYHKRRLHSCLLLLPSWCVVSLC
eukprot:m.76142 g.76142  ORF g.76142 m.76142 type:complete len:111 (-) comp12478_c0_seq6:1189-1521(-)